jgi:hypothetical protein
MKNSILIALFAFATAGIFSCTKSEPVHSSIPTSNDRTIATDLFSVQLESRTDDNGIVYLIGERSLEQEGISSADVNNHHAFIYATGQSHQLLPINIATGDANFIISAILNGSSITVRVDTDSPDQGINADQFQNMMFQVLLVSDEDYSRLQQQQIDWSDYFAVFAAIRSLPLPRVPLESDSQAGLNN